MKSAIIFIVRNFPLVMLLLSVLIAFSRNTNFFNRLCNAILFFAVGFTGIWGFVLHEFYSDITAANIGWQSNPFEHELAVADLAMGIIGVIACFASNGYKKATATFVSIFLIGIAVEHIRQIILVHNVHPGNIGTILWTYMLIPVVLWSAILFSKEKQPHQINWANH